MNNQKPLNEQEARDIIKRFNESKSEQDIALSEKRLEQIQAPMRRREKQRQRLRKVAPFGMALALAGVYLTTLTSSLYFIGLGLVVIGTGIIIACIPAYPGLYKKEFDEICHTIEKTKLEVASPYFVRMQVELFDNEKETDWQAITIDLQQVSSLDVCLMSAEAKICLNRRLSSIQNSDRCTSEQVEFCLAWLKILEQIGDKRDFMTVYAIARTTAKSQFHHAIQEAAWDCLPRIEARMKAPEPDNILLRASEAPPDSGKTLLRPAAKANPTAPNELLRPVEPEDDAPPA